MGQDRRTFLKLSAAASAASLGRTPLAAQTPLAAVRELDPRALRAVGDAVLPEELGADGREAAVSAFEIWLAGFRPVAELTHPYGGWEIPYGPAHPEPGWASQLEALELLARAQGDVGFAELSIERRRALLIDQMGAPPEGFPPPELAAHVALALMAHYFTSPVAIDRCYDVRIGRLECRSTDDVGAPPEPLDP